MGTPLWIRLKKLQWSTIEVKISYLVPLEGLSAARRHYANPEDLIIPWLRAFLKNSLDSFYETIIDLYHYYHLRMSYDDYCFICDKAIECLFYDIAEIVKNRELTDLIIYHDNKRLFCSLFNENTVQISLCTNDSYLVDLLT